MRQTTLPGGAFVIGEPVVILDADAADKLWVYNRTCLHYDLTARAIYARRGDGADVFETGYLAYLVAGLVVFDLERQMGRGAEQRYLPEEGGFAFRLQKALEEIRPALEPLLAADLMEAELDQMVDRIAAGYRVLSRGGSSGLHAEGKEFHVGATRVLHFLNPQLFITIDGPTARAFCRHHGVDFATGIQPGYSCQKYIDCLSHAQNEVRRFGPGFPALEPGTPLARLFDKIAYVTGQEEGR